MGTIAARAGFVAGRSFERLVSAWVRTLGRPVAEPAEPWIDGPIADGPVGSTFYERHAEARGLELRRGDPSAGLLADFDRLRGPLFDPDAVDPRVRGFYERTAAYHLDAWSQWSPLFQPFGWALMTTVSRRMKQLNIPVSPLETSRGMTSEVIAMSGPDGRRDVAGWLRTSAGTGDVVYAGFYSVATPPKAPGPCVKVVFPVPNGNATVLLRPQVGADGSLLLVSGGSGFGDSGFYRVVRTRPGKWRVRYLSAMKESIHVYVDEHGTLRTDHLFRFFRAEILRLHYKITAVAPGPVETDRR